MGKGESLLSALRVSGAKAGSGEEKGASEFESILYLFVPNSAHPYLPSYLPRWELMGCGTAGFLKVPFNYPWVVFIARINLLRTTPETAGRIWSQQAGVRGGRGSQEGEAGDDTARTGERVQGGVWSQLRAPGQRTVSQCGMSAAPGNRAAMILSTGIPSSQTSIHFEGRRNGAGTRRRLCSALSSLASPFLLSPSSFLLHILSDVLHADPSVELCFAAAALLIGIKA